MVYETDHEKCHLHGSAKGSLAYSFLHLSKSNQIIVKISNLPEIRVLKLFMFVKKFVKLNGDLH